MAIILLKRQGLDDAEPIARWEDGEWIAGDEEKYRFIGDEYYETFDDEMMLDHFNGPDIFATTEEAYQGDIDEELPVETESAGVDISDPDVEIDENGNVVGGGTVMPFGSVPVADIEEAKKEHDELNADGA